MVRVATCCCGALSITVDGSPSVHGVCHCADCKKRTGSAFGLSAYFDDGQIRGKSGAAATYVITGDNDQQRNFCVTCGTTLYWTSAHFAGMTGIAGGCFTDPPLPEPTVTLSNDGRCSWLRLPGQWAKR